MRNFCCEKAEFSNNLDFIWTWTLHLKRIWAVVGLGLSFLRQDWIWIAKYESPLIWGQ